eukprot:1161230-Pelagomonas_calceolata.AAC.5
MKLVFEKVWSDPAGNDGLRGLVGPSISCKMTRAYRAGSQAWLVYITGVPCVGVCVTGLPRVCVYRAGLQAWLVYITGVPCVGLQAWPVESAGNPLSIRHAIPPAMSGVGPASKMWLW